VNKDSRPLPVKENLGRLFASGLVWTAAARFSAQLLSWASFVIVARLLTPADFGVVTGASTFTGIIALIAEFGLGSAIIARPSLTSTEKSQLLGASVLAGLLAMLVCLAMSIPLSKVLKLAALREIVPVVGCTLAIVTVNSVYLAILRREMAFSNVALIEMLKAISQAAFSLAFAVLGWEYWALVLSELGSAVVMLLLLQSRLQLRPQAPNRSVLGDWVVFGRDLVISRVAWYAYTNADFVIVGRRFGGTALGDYSLAFTLVSLPVDKLATLIFSVAPSVLARLRDDPDALKGYILLLFELLAIVVLPLSVGLSLTVRELVIVVLGDKWERAIPLVQAMSLFAIAKSFAPISAAVLISIGNTSEPRRQSLVGLAVMPLAFLIGSFWGVLGVAMAWTVVFPFLTIAQLARAMRALQIHVRNIFTTIRPALYSTVIMALVLGLMKLMLSTTVFPVYSRLCLLVLTGAVTFLLSMWVLARQRLRVLWTSLRRPQSM